MTAVEPTPNESAIDSLRATLAAYGLQSLGDFVWKEYLQNIPIEQIFLDMRQTPEYKQRFPAMAKLSAEGRALTEKQYIDYENTAREVFKAAGLPQGFYDSPEDFTKFLENDISTAELQDRTKAAQNAIYNFAPEDLAALEQFYHINGRPGQMEGDIAAYVLDEQRALPVIQNQFQSAHTAGIAARSGFGINQTQAEWLAQLGITSEQAGQGFGTLGKLEPLFNTLPGETNNLTKQQGLEAVFADSGEAASAVEAQGKRRRAKFQQAGQFTETQKGISGVGSA